MNDDQIKLILISLILLVGLGLPVTGILIWFIKNIATPIGTLEGIVWALDSPDPWVWVGRLTLIAITGLLVATAIAWIKDKTGL